MKIEQPNIEIREVNADQVMDIRHSELWPDRPRDFVRIPDDALGVHFGLYIEGQLVSVISLFSAESSLRFRKFATLADFRRRGLGTLLMQEVLEYAKATGHSRIWCDARADALAFYKRFQFQEFGEPFFKGEIPYRKIEKWI
ncbi:GNAT family N-acetyltransferase [Dyadobacter jejuensis]|nr:GNAT family N-acetyltransferase [Dyadobacter jejuensis]